MSRPLCGLTTYICSKTLIMRIKIEKPARKLEHKEKKELYLSEMVKILQQFNVFQRKTSLKDIFRDIKG